MRGSTTGNGKISSKMGEANTHTDGGVHGEEWKDGKQNGRGKHLCPGGGECDGEWRNEVQINGFPFSVPAYCVLCGELSK